MDQCVVHARKGLPCRTRVSPASSPASHCTQCSALTSPSLHARGCASPSRARWGHRKHNMLFQWVQNLGTPTVILKLHLVITCLQALVDRFSALREFKFPPKKWFSSFATNTVERRRANFEVYLKELVRMPIACLCMRLRHCTCVRWF